MCSCKSTAGVCSQEQKQDININSRCWDDIVGTEPEGRPLPVYRSMCAVRERIDRSFGIVAYSTREDRL